MMLASGLGPSFLHRAVQYAVHIRNLTPSVGRNVTMHFSMFGVNVDISRFREFGCPARVFIPPGMRTSGKLALRRVKGRFIGLGMPLGSPAYLVQLDNRVIQTSDVTFTELQSLAHVSGELPLDTEPLSSHPVTAPSSHFRESSFVEQIVPVLSAGPVFPADSALPGDCVGSGACTSEQESPVSFSPMSCESVGSVGGPEFVAYESCANDELGDSPPSADAHSPTVSIDLGVGISMLGIALNRAMSGLRFRLRVSLVMTHRM